MLRYHGKSRVRINPVTGLPLPPLTVRWAEWVGRMSARRAYGWTALLVVALAALDHLTDYQWGLSRFHMVPIALMAWHRGRNAGLWTSAVCLVLWAVGEEMVIDGGSMAVHVWDAAVRGFYFVSAVLALSALRVALNEERSLARTDFLTGVANRRFFSELANKEIRRARRYHAPFIVAYIDIDGFKKVNDRFGHDEGDSLLRLVAQSIRDSLRDADTVARMGGDEFAILFPETDGIHARDIMRKVQGRLARVMSEKGWPVTFSIGTVSYPTPPASVDEMIKTADKLMYTVKDKGKNNIGFAVAGAAARLRD